MSWVVYYVILIQNPCTYYDDYILFYDQSYMCHIYERLNMIFSLWYPIKIYYHPVQTLYSSTRMNQKRINIQYKQSSNKSPFKLHLQIKSHVSSYLRYWSIPYWIDTCFIFDTRGLCMRINLSNKLRKLHSRVLQFYIL